LVRGLGSAADGRNPWLETYNEARRFWSPPANGQRQREALATVLRGTPFQVTDVLEVETSHELAASDLAQRVLTFSSTSPEMLADKVEPMLRDVGERLSPHSRGGRLTEIVVSTAEIARRMG
jgi:hypothetical protein